MWIVLWGLLIFLLLVVLLLLFSPLVLKIDTDTGTYVLRYGGLARATVAPENLAVRLWIFFWQKEFSLLDWEPGKEKEKPKKAEKPKKKRKSKTRFQFLKWKRKMGRVFRAIRIKVFRLDIDTDDYVLNSYLYPVCYFLDRSQKQLTVNYNGAATLKLTASVVPARVLIALII